MTHCINLNVLNTLLFKILESVIIIIIIIYIIIYFFLKKFLLFQ